MGMQLRIYVLLAILSGPCAAQDVFSIYSRLAPPSPSSGNGGQVGLGVDGVVHTGQHLMFDVDVSAVKEAKSYVGDGWTIRGQAEVLAGAGAWWIGGGMTSGYHSNSQYSKGQYQPIVSVHYRPHLLLDLYGTYLFPASGNGNQVKGWRAGYRGVLRAAPGARYGMFVQVEYTQYSFLTAFGDKRAANTITTGLGISRIVEKIR